MQLDEASAKILKVRKVMLRYNDARESLDYAKSDFLREKLKDKYGVEVKDQKGGPSGWKFIDGSSTKMKSGAKLPLSYVEEVKNMKEKRKKKLDNSNKKKRGLESENVIIESEERVSSKKQRKSEAKKINACKDEQQRNKSLLANIVPNVSSKVRNINGVMVEELTTTNGQIVHRGDRVKVHYVGRLKTTGKIFDSSLKRPFTFCLGKGDVIRGWDIGIEGMSVGSKRKLTIPPEKAYGRSGAPPVIPSNATLIFEVTLLGTY